MSSLGRTYEIENNAFSQLIGTKQEYHKVNCVLFAWVIRLKKASDNTEYRPLHDSVPNPVINNESITKGIFFNKMLLVSIFILKLLTRRVCTSWLIV